MWNKASMLNLLVPCDQIIKSLRTWHPWSEENKNSDGSL